MTRILWLSRQHLTDIERELLEQTGEVQILDAETRAEAIAQVRAQNIDLVLVNAGGPTCVAEQLLLDIPCISPRLPVVVHNREASVEEAVRMIQLGAADYLTGVPSAQTVLSLARKLSQAGDAPEGKTDSDAVDEPWRKLLIGTSPPIREVIKTIGLVASLRSTVLISGETGTGKEVAARAIHLASNRAKRPLVSMNCAALPEHLIEAELFGHVRGAFTGAIQSRPGRFEQAAGGTLFLDEVGDIPFGLQAKLLRVLQEREFQRLGSSETVRVDVRIIAASNLDLEKAVGDGKFRPDLFYRLNVVPLRLPPLRERKTDIPSLIQHFIAKVCTFENLTQKVVSPGTVTRLMAYSWPGNVRQLEHAVETAIALSGSRPTLYPVDFPIPRCNDDYDLCDTVSVPNIQLPEDGLDLSKTIMQLERALVQEALSRTGGNKARAANLLGMKRSTLHARIALLG